MCSGCCCNANCEEPSPLDYIVATVGELDPQDIRNVIEETRPALSPEETSP